MPTTRALIDRAERRLKNLNYFKTVKITRKPGSAPDRVVLDVEVAEQSTGDFNIAGGYSTTDGLLAEVKLGDRNFLGTGEAVNGSVTYGQYARGIDLSASEPYFLGTRVSAGIELYRQAESGEPLPVLWQRHLWRDDAVRHAADRADRRAVPLFDL